MMVWLTGLRRAWRRQGGTRGRGVLPMAPGVELTSPSGFDLTSGIVLASPMVRFDQARHILMSSI